MGACAGCMGPDRRAQNYRVNRLTENSPIKSKISPSQLPFNRNKDKIYQDVHQSRKKLGPNNLIATLINSNYDMNRTSQLSTINKPTTSFYPSPQPFNQVYLRDSYLNEQKQKRNSLIYTKKYENNNYYDENIIQSKIIDNSAPFLSQLKTKSIKKNQSYQLNDDTSFSKIYRSSINEFKTNNKIVQISKFPKKGLLNIPQLSDQESKTPQYVKQIRKQNGQDIQKTNLQIVPRKIQSVQPLNLFKYLKDLK